MRVSDLEQRAQDQPSFSISPRRLWLALSTAMFVGYGLLFFSRYGPFLSSTPTYSKISPVLTAALTTGGGVVTIVIGAVALALGLRAAQSSRSWRVCWPSITLGASLLALVFIWGWRSVARAVPEALNPIVWTQVARTGPFALLNPGLFQLSASLLLLGLTTTACIAIAQRLAASSSQRRKPRRVNFRLVVASVTTACVWLWVANVGFRDLSMVPIVWGVSLSAVSMVCATLCQRRTAVPSGTTLA